MAEKCAADDPRRCQAVTANGQCQYLAIEGEEKCDFHLKGPVKRPAQKRVERYIIENQELKRSYDRQKQDVNFLDMRQEIDLLHGLVEMRLNQIKTPADSAMAIPQVDKLIQRLESMKMNLLKIQESIGRVITKDQLRLLAIEIAGILDQELEGIPNKEDYLDRISERIVDAIENSSEPKS